LRSGKHLSHHGRRLVLQRIGVNALRLLGKPGAGFEFGIVVQIEIVERAALEPASCRPANRRTLLRLQRVRFFGERIDKFSQGWGEKQDEAIIVSIIFLLIEHDLPERIWL
jgi:hypothetical protein